MKQGVGIGLLAGLVLLVGSLCQLGVAAVAPADLSSPKGAVMAFVQALADGNAETAKAASVANTAAEQAVDAYVAFAQGCRAYDEAMQSKWGPEARMHLSSNFIREFPQRFSQAAVKPDGDGAATVSASRTDAFFHLNDVRVLRVDGQWRVDLNALPSTQLLTRVLPKVLVPMARAYEGVAAEIAAGKYKTAAEAEQAEKQATDAAFQNALRPPSATTPSSQPSH